MSAGDNMASLRGGECQTGGTQIPPSQSNNIGVLKFAIRVRYGDTITDNYACYFPAKIRIDAF